MACGEPGGAACGQGAEDRRLARARWRPVRERRAVRHGVGALAPADLADAADHRGARRRAGRRRDGGGGGAAVVGAGAALLARLCRGVGGLLGCERDELGRGAYLRAPRREAPQRCSSAAPHGITDPHHPAVLRSCAACDGTACQVDATAAGRRVLTLRPLAPYPDPLPLPLPPLLLIPTPHCTLHPMALSRGLLSAQPRRRVALRARPPPAALHPRPHAGRQACRDAAAVRRPLTTGCAPGRRAQRGTAVGARRRGDAPPERL